MRPHPARRFIPPVCLAGLVIASAVFAAVPAGNIYWGDAVPKGWNGSWPSKLQTVPERTRFERTASSAEILDLIDAFRWSSDKVAVLTVYTSPLRRTCPAIVLASPRVATPQEAAKSGKTVVYLQGNIHPYEPEGKEALLMLSREILFGRLTRLLDDLVVIVCPSFNVDGNDTVTLAEGTPHIVGSGNNSQNLNLNRDAVRVDTVEVAGLYRTIFNRWDPTLVFDAHMMGRVQHGYANAYTTCTVPAAHPGPRGYVFDKLFPAVREATRREFGLEVFTHCGTDNRWPPTVWGHEQAIWTTEAKFVANMYGLRSRMSILAETPGHESFERRIYAHFALIAEVLKYAAAHGKEMREICAAADREVVDDVLAKAESGSLRNFVAGRYASRGKVDILAYRPRNVPELFPGTSVRGKMPAAFLGPPEVVPGVEFMTLPVGTLEAKVPRAYLIPSELGFVAEKLRIHNVKVETLSGPVRAEGEEFVIGRMGTVRGGGGATTKLEGAFAPMALREFPAGTFRVDMAQPMANAAFYLLEPQAADGFAGSGVFDDHLKTIGVEKRSVAYPVVKVFKVPD